MIVIGIVGSSALVTSLRESVPQGIECPEVNQVEGSEQLAAMIIESDFLSLRLVADCDARSIPFAIVTSSQTTEKASFALGVEVALPCDATWNDILNALGMAPSVVEGPPEVPAVESRDLGNESVGVNRDARVIAVWGPAGAPGRSCLAVNIAAETALAGSRVLLIDADTYGGAIAGYLELFDEAPGFLAASRLAGNGHLTEAEIGRLAHCYAIGTTNFWVLSGIVSSRRWPELGASRVRECLQVLQSHFDVIVCDVGFNLEQDEEISSDLGAPRRNQATLAVMGCADVVVAVTGADVIGIARFIQSLELLKQCAGDAELEVVANRVRENRSSNASIVRHTLQRFAGFDDVAVVNDDRTSFMAALDRAAPLCVSAPKSVARTQLAALAQKVTSRIAATVSSGS